MWCFLPKFKAFFTLFGSWINNKKWKRQFSFNQHLTTFLAEFDAFIWQFLARWLSLHKWWGVLNHGKTPVFDRAFCVFGWKIQLFQITLIMGAGEGMGEGSGAGEWSHGLCGCFDNFTVCIITYFLPCYTSGKNAEAVGESCLLYGVGWTSSTISPIWR